MSVTKGILDAYMLLAPSINELFSADVAVSLYDRVSNIKYVPGDSLDIGDYEGILVSERKQIKAVIETGVKVRKIVPKERFGIPVKATLIPLKEKNGECVGCLAITESIDKQVQLSAMSETVASALEELTAGVDEISNGASSVYDNSKESNTINSVVRKQMNRTDEILKYIYKTSDKSNMLGLNASIEAARAGEFGRGFAVVAEEIRKLSNDTKEYANEIKIILEELHLSTTKISDLIEISYSISEMQKESTDQILLALVEISNTSQELAEFSKNI